MNVELDGALERIVTKFVSRDLKTERFKQQKFGGSGMDETNILTEAMRAEKSIKLYTRISAVRYVLLGHSTSDAATHADVTQRTVQLWVERFRADGVDGLRDLPGRRGHPKCDPAKVAKHALVLSRKNALTPKSLCERVRSKLHVRYSVVNMRAIMREAGFSRKVSVTRLGNAADPADVKKWQIDAFDAISRAKRRGKRIVVVDESIFGRVGKNGAKLWSLVGERIEVVREGYRDKVVVYGGIADNNTSIMRTYDKFNAANFVNYLAQLRRKYPEGVLLIMDNAVQHKSKKVRKYLERNPEMEVLFLPVARPELSAIEEIWRRAKYRLITSKYYKSSAELRTAVSEHFRTCSIKIDIYAYLKRSV